MPSVLPRLAPECSILSSNALSSEKPSYSSHLSLVYCIPSIYYLTEIILFIESLSSVSPTLEGELREHSPHVEEDLTDGGHSANICSLNES